MLLNDLSDRDDMGDLLPAIRGDPTLDGELIADLFYGESSMAIALIPILGWFSKKQLVRGPTFGAVK